MSIHYSLSAHSSVPSDPDARWLVYPRVQYSELMDLDEFARHIQEHGSPFRRDVITGVLTAAVDCLLEQLVAGKKVNFGDLGAFHLALRSDGAPSAEEFNPETHVKQIDVRWEQSELFKNLKNHPGISWQYVLSRRTAAAAKRKAKELLDEELRSAAEE